ncbi:TIGR03915 family putative DNA repair protein [Thermosipho ferrireducens]|uniref:TIGR03915 family putative DNA repair protein n=1 Tax=Thermosipho ferrireducens TaxID=2571116 RepID=A0ABX7S7V8_9BACT|nr:TIGR03915 family putative DNA repair protein [Thermosipho ferrireducens]QTA37712.1 TIGR03915 family putative DNA repair protein [Thermosipho ferrireducens]
MKIFTYDGTFAGLLSLISYCYKQKILPDFIYKECSPGFFDIFEIHKEIKTNQKDSKFVVNLIIQKTDLNVLKNIFLGYLSDMENIEATIVKYFFLCINLNKNAEMFIKKDCVIKLKRVLHKVKKEAHKFTGLLRFRKISNELYYAPFEPDHNIIPLLRNHFVKRFPTQNWIIHDLRRNIALFYNKDTASTLLKFSSDIPVLKKEQLPHDEVFFQKLWKEYFNSVTIKERKNLKLQRQYMPLRYWKYLTEL